MIQDQTVRQCKVADLGANKLEVSWSMNKTVIASLKLYKTLLEIAYLIFTGKWKEGDVTG